MSHSSIIMSDCTEEVKQTDVDRPGGQKQDPATEPFIMTPTRLLARSDVNPHALLLHGVLTGLSRERGYAYAGNDYLARLFNCRVLAVCKWVKELEAKGFIRVERTMTRTGTERKIYVEEPGDAPAAEPGKTRKSAKVTPVEEPQQVSVSIYADADMQQHIFNGTSATAHLQTHTHNRKPDTKEKALEKKREEKKSTQHNAPSATGVQVQLSKIATEGFNRFWAVFPKRVAKVEAEAVWKRLGPDENLTATILDAVRRWKDTDNWQKEGGKYVPYPAKWLRGKQWEDEPPSGMPTPLQPRPPSVDPEAHLKEGGMIKAGLHPVPDVLDKLLAMGYDLE